MLVNCPAMVAARSRPRHTFIMTPQRSLTFSDFANQVRHYRRQLPAVIASPPSRVLISMHRSPEHIALMLALMTAGYLTIPVEPGLPEARRQELQTQLQSDIWVSPEMMASAPVSTRDPDIRLYRPCLGILTSGSTGTVKLVIHNLATLINSAHGSNRILPMKAYDRTLQSLPLHHIGGLQQWLRSLLSETTLVMDGAVENPEQLLQWHITHTSMVATQLQRLVLTRTMLAELKSILLGGGPCPEPVLRAARAHRYPIWQTYGMSETASQLVTRSPKGQVFVMPGNEVKLSGEHELLIRGQSLFLGYLNQGRLDVARDHNGWFHSGDLGMFSGEGLEITGRKDNRFTSGGKNIQPEEIEGHLIAQGVIQQAIVVPVAHPEFGLVPFAFIRHAPQSTISDNWQEELITQLRARLPGYLVPRHFATLPPQRGLKPQRRVLQQLAQQQVNTMTTKKARTTLA